MTPTDTQADEETGIFPQLLDRETTSFVANGVTYEVDRNSGLSVARDRWLEKFSLYSMLGRQPVDIISAIKEAYAAVNNSKLADAAVKLDNLLVGVMNLESKAGPLWYVCTLFINRKGEDRRKYSLADADAKIADWEAEGLDRDFFMGAGLAYLMSTASDYVRLTQSYSELGIQPRPNLDLKEE